jgi:hypothetical protein
MTGRIKRIKVGGFATTAGVVHRAAARNQAKIKFTIPNFTLGQATKSDYNRDGGPLTRNIQVPMPPGVGIDLSAVDRRRTRLS